MVSLKVQPPITDNQTQDKMTLLKKNNLLKTIVIQGKVFEQLKLS